MVWYGMYSLLFHDMFTIKVIEMLLLYSLMYVCVYVLVVYSEVENRIAAFRKMLYEKLMVMPSSPDEQKKLIRLVSVVKFLMKPFILFCVESLS